MAETYPVRINLDKILDPYESEEEDELPLSDELFSYMRSELRKITVIREVDDINEECDDENDQLKDEIVLDNPLELEEEVGKEEDSNMLARALAYVGIRSESAGKGQFIPSCGLLVGVGEAGDFYYRGKRIKEFNLPHIGAERLTERIINNSTIFNGYFSENAERDNYILGCREKLDGVQAIQFEVVMENDYKLYFFWDDKDLQISDNVGVALFEKYGDRLYLLQGDVKGKVCGMEVIVHEYHPLTLERYNQFQRSKDGMILNINGIDYKCPQERIITLKYYRGAFRDKQNKVYLVLNSPVLNEDRFVDCVDKGGELYYYRDRHDKINADSSDVIKVISKDLVVMDQLKLLLVMPNEIKRYTKINSLTYKGLILSSVREKIDAINAAQSDNYGSKSVRTLMYVKGRYSSKRDRDFFQTLQEGYNLRTGDWSRECSYYLCGTSHRRYYPKYRKLYKVGRIVISNEWFSGARKFSIKRNESFKWYRDVPGKGICTVIFLRIMKVGGIYERKMIVYN